MYRDEDGKVVRRGERGTNVSIYFSRRNRHILDSLYDLIDAGKISSISQFVNTAVEDKWKKDQVQQPQVQQPQVA
jgi:hypothetical protein